MILADADIRLTARSLNFVVFDVFDEGIHDILTKLCFRPGERRPTRPVRIMRRDRRDAKCCSRLYQEALPRPYCVCPSSSEKRNPEEHQSPSRLLHWSLVPRHGPWWEHSKTEPIHLLHLLQTSNGPHGRHRLLRSGLMCSCRFFRPRKIRSVVSRVDRPFDDDHQHIQ